jgi:hypothetical protein
MLLKSFWLPTDIVEGGVEICEVVADPTDGELHAVKVMASINVSPPETDRRKAILGPL